MPPAPSPVPTWREGELSCFLFLPTVSRGDLRPFSAHTPLPQPVLLQSPLNLLRLLLGHRGEKRHGLADLFWALELHRCGRASWLRRGAYATELAFCPRTLPDPSTGGAMAVPPHTWVTRLGSRLGSEELSCSPSSPRWFLRRVQCQSTSLGCSFLLRRDFRSYFNGGRAEAGGWGPEHLTTLLPA